MQVRRRRHPCRHGKYHPFALAARSSQSHKIKQQHRNPPRGAFVSSVHRRRSSRTTLMVPPTTSRGGQKRRPVQGLQHRDKSRILFIEKYVHHRCENYRSQTRNNNSQRLWSRASNHRRKKRPGVKVTTIQPCRYLVPPLNLSGEHSSRHHHQKRYRHDPDGDSRAAAARQPLGRRYLARGGYVTDDIFLDVKIAAQGRRRDRRRPGSEHPPTAAASCES